MSARRGLWLSLIALGAALLSILALLYIWKQDFDERGHARNVGLLRQLRQLDAQWELEVLKSRLGISTHYDRLAEARAGITQSLAQLAASLGGSRDIAVNALSGRLVGLSEAIADKTALIEQFKSSNSILRNSLAFLPTAAAEVRGPVGGASGPVARPVVDVEDVSPLLLATVLFTQSVSIERGAEILRGLDLLHAGHRQWPVAARQRLDIFVAHARAVLREQPIVNALLDDIAAAPTATRIDDLNDALLRLNLQAEESNRRYDTYLLLFSIVLISLLWYAAAKLIRNRGVIRRVNLALQRANERLEQRVLERTRELDEAQAQLIATARQAGMAEIATNVLHNVGNVLNAVTTAAGQMGQLIRASRLGGLDRVVMLLDQHGHDLGRFLTQDSKGQLLLPYIRELAAALVCEQQSLATELAVLAKSVEHIKHVIATQQSYAGTTSGRVVEAVRLADVVADALAMNAGALMRHNVHVMNGVAEFPEMLLDRNRVLLILVNLISNGKQALAAQTGPTGAAPTLTLGASLDAQRVLRITVADNGEGIPPENLTRIYAHGFTTRRHGHGFGLHSCALAAREMGGRLSAQSAGVGQGACFTLEVPLAAPEIQ